MRPNYFACIKDCLPKQFVTIHSYTLLLSYYRLNQWRLYFRPANQMILKTPSLREKLSRWPMTPARIIANTKILLTLHCWKNYLNPYSFQTFFQGDGFYFGLWICSCVWTLARLSYLQSTWFSIWYAAVSPNKVYCRKTWNNLRICILIQLNQLCAPISITGIEDRRNRWQFLKSPKEPFSICLYS